MINLKENSRVFVYCPANAVTGGAELLHQLVDSLNCKGKDAYIVYHKGYWDENSNVKYEVPEEYKEYNIKISNKIIDNSLNIVVISEGNFYKAFETKNCQILLWWLSVDHFFHNSRDFLKITDYLKYDFKYFIKTIIRRFYYFFIKGQNHFRNKHISLKKLNNLKALNCYQSEYAQNFLIKNNFSEILPLTDFINKEIVNNKSHIGLRKNTVIYNPKKGLEFTKKLIELAPDIDWIPLQNMSRKELIDTIKESKVYIDFGYHPGKDRLAREAAICGCCVITNREGSANFFEDVMIYDEYKFNKGCNKGEIIGLIKDIFENFEERKLDFVNYRNKIVNERIEFENQVNQIF